MPTTPSPHRTMQAETDGPSDRHPAAPPAPDPLLDFLQRAIDGDYTNPPTGETPLAALLRSLAATLEAKEIERQKLSALLSNTGTLTDHVVQLQQHAENAGIAQEGFMGEIDQRSGDLRRNLDDARQQIASSVATADEMQKTTRSVIENTTAEIRNELETIRAQLTDKADSTREILQGITDIGKGIRLLALNAAIEAKRAGEHGLGFTVVAQEVKALAHKTMQQTEQAEEVIDLSQANKDLSGMLEHIGGSFDSLLSKIEQAMTSLSGLFDEASGRLEEVSEHNQVVFEMLLGSKDTSQRTLSKLKWARAQMEATNSILAHPVADADDRMVDLMHRNYIPTESANDLLADIRDRKLLRVAVEPSFIGLSFRRQPGEPLRGLDIDYVRAFAARLGVEVEFIEHPWDIITELLVAGPTPGTPKADVVWSALPPNAAYSGTAYSETYTCLNYVLCRRKGDDRIGGLGDLDGKVLGIINDPGAFEVLEQAGVRWQKNLDVPGGRTTLANLIAYTDQSRIHDCLVEGAVDAFAVDLPIYYWACNDPASPWFDKIEILTGNLAAVPYYYAAAVADRPSSYRFLAEIDKFIAWFKQQPERDKIEKAWQGAPIAHPISYRDEPGNLRGAAELKIDFEAVQQSN